MIPVCTETMRELSPALLVPDRLSGPHLRPRSVPSSPCRRHAAHRVHTDGEPAAFALYGLGSEHAQTETVSPPQWPRPSARLLPLPLTTEGLAKICTQLLTIFLSTKFSLLGSHLVEKCRRSGTLGSSTCTQHSLFGPRGTEAQRESTHEVRSRVTDACRFQIPTRACSKADDFLAAQADTRIPSQRCSRGRS